MNAVRIIGGEWRRRVLRFPDAAGLRPTPDRVRETLFNWLGQDLSGRSCLDLFAGSGALGFEAASRGAARVLMVDNAPKVLAALEANARTLKADDRLQIVRADAVKFASSQAVAGVRFDVVFVDPPYQQGWIDRLAPLVTELVHADGALYLEADRALSGIGVWRTVRNGRAGQVYFHLLRRGKADDAQ
ncbi:MAG: 16S rRNA (guanine(966)-N(2))-methyltransferase RsmD [Propionivibrio sp.]